MNAGLKAKKENKNWNLECKTNNPKYEYYVYTQKIHIYSNHTFIGRPSRFFKSNASDEPN